MNDAKLALHPSEIARYFELDKCPKYIFWLSKKSELEEKANELDEKIRKRLKGEIDEILREQGKNFEEGQQKILEKITKIPRIQKNSSFNELKKYIIYGHGCEKQACIFVQPSLKGQIGVYAIDGRADIVLVRHHEQKTEVWVFEAKFTNQEKFHHRLQAIVYAKLVYDAVHKELQNQGRSLEMYVSVLTKNNTLELGLANIKKLRFPDDTETYTEILEDVLKKDGTFDKIISEKETPRFWISSRCQECPYEAFCIKEAVEKKGLELLGVRPGDQEILEEVGIHNLEDLADLYEYQDLYPVGRDGFKPLKPKLGKEERINNILSRLNISNLQKLAQGAYRLVRELNCDFNNFPDWIKGSGYNLPRDIYDEDRFRGNRVPVPSYPSGSLVRIYIFVQHDPIYDRIVLVSATVDNTLTSKSRTISELIHIPLQKLGNFNYSEDKVLDFFEKELLENFFKKLIWAINDVRPQLPDDQCYIHLYFYSKFQRFKFMEAIKRHSELYGYKPLRWLLGLRREIDQEMVSIIKDEITRRHALRFPGLGIVPVVAHYRWNDNNYYWNEEYGGWFRWDSDLKLEFDEIFKIGSPKECEEDITLNIYGQLRDVFPDISARIPSERYPVISRELEQIPLKYVWKLTTTKAGRFNLKKLAVNFALAIRHIERSIPEWSKDTTVRKRPIPASELEIVGFEDISLADVLVEYQKLEYQTKKEAMEEHYRLPIKERGSTGKSLLVEIESIETIENENRRNTTKIIHGSLLLPDGQQWNSENAPPISLSEDSFVVVTPVINEHGTLRPVTKYTDPKSIRYSLLASIQFLDEKSGKVSLKLLSPFAVENYEFVAEGHLYVDRENNVRRLRNGNITLQPGLYLIIDETIDDINSSRAYTVLTAIRENESSFPLYFKLNSIYTSQKIMEDDKNLMKITPPWNKEDIEEFIDTFLSRKINHEQRDFILEDWNKSLVTLQGPPGTGKTSWAVSPAILSRIYSSLKQRRDILVLVTGISHRAINEALTSFVKLLNLLKEVSDNKIKIFNSINIYRLVNSAEQRNKMEEELRDITAFINFIDYNNDTLPFRFPEEGTRTIMEFISGRSRAVVIFGTPGAISSISNRTNLPADLIVIDEASMMDLPMFLLATSFIKENGQVLMVGDHRQMEPIQQHDWEHEDRETIEQHTPFLSAINFIRFLRGELSESEREIIKRVLYRNPPSWEDSNLKKDLLPFHRLNKTYRFPQLVADVLTDLFYTHDGIKLESKKEEIQKLEEESKKFRKELHEYIDKLSDNHGKIPITHITTPEYPITLVLHDENKSTKINEVEKIIISEIIRSLPKEYTSEDKLGIVVPFKAQRAQIRSLLRELGLEHVQVDTVERFQGGEKDIIIISLTASDPSYLSAVLEFLFNPNRLNVAMSRMKEKLILIGSQEVFNATARDVQKFEELIEPWRTLFRKIRSHGKKLWDGTLEEFVEEPDTSADRYQRVLEKYKEISLEIFGMKEWPENQ